MRPSTRALLGILLLAAWSCSDGAGLVVPEEPRPPVEAQATVDRAVATTGDLITYRIVVDADAGLEVEIPEAGAEIAGFRIVDLGREESRQRQDRILHERWYALRADLVGSYVLPPVEIGYRARQEADVVAEAPWQRAATSAIFVEVESVLPAEGGAEDIRGLKPLRELRPTFAWWQAGVALLVVVLLALGLWWYLRRRARKAAALPAVPPHEVAFAALDALRQTDFADPEAVRSFYFRLSEVLRTYVEGRFAINATDLTTEEILASLVGLEELPAEPRESLRCFLLDSDQVKFAHHDPGREEIEATWERALGFVESTRPPPEVGETEILEEAA